VTAGLEIAGPEDAETLLGLMERFYAEERYPFDREKARAALEPFLAVPSLGRTWLFRDGATAVGYFVLTLGWSLEYGGRDAFVDEIFVSPSHRGRGLGRRALDAIAEACLELGVRALHLEVEKDNVRASELYRKWGFEDSHRRLMTRRFAGDQTLGANEVL
jgi:ribosomal protein S18 acetylase RimI-like enzyme